MPGTGAGRPALEFSRVETAVRNPYFPFQALGYRCNPFRALTPDERIRVAVLPREVLEAFHDSGRHLQVLGEKGRGKTTTLLALAERAREAGLQVAYERVPEDRRSYHTDMRGLELFVLDEAQRLSFRERRRLAAPGGPRLLLGTHRCMAAALRRSGRQVRSLDLDPGSRELLALVVRKRLEQFALPGVERVELTEGALDALWERFGSDLRAVEHQLYAVFQRLDRLQPITPELLG